MKAKLHSQFQPRMTSICTSAILHIVLIKGSICLESSAVWEKASEPRVRFMGLWSLNPQTGKRLLRLRDLHGSAPKTFTSYRAFKPSKGSGNYIPQIENRQTGLAWWIFKICVRDLTSGSRRGPGFSKICQVATQCDPLR